MSIRNLGDLSAALNRIERAVLAAASDAATAGGEVLAEGAADRAEGRGGEIAVNTVADGVVEIEPQGPGARIHEFGGVITPDTADKLVFDIDGETVFAEVVLMPARPYMRPAADEDRDAAADAAREVLRDAIQRAT
jgi:hypothetical protein